MEILLNEFRKSGEEVWLIVQGSLYLSYIKSVSNELVTFTYQVYSPTTKAYGLWERTTRIHLIDAVEKRITIIPEDFDKALKSFKQVETSNETDAWN